jgi:hypothetical protein
MYEMAPKTRESETYIYNNPKVMNELGRVLDPSGEKGLTFSPADGLWKTADGGVYNVAPSRLAEMAPALTGIIDRRTNDIVMSTDRLMRLSNERSKLSNAIRPSAPRGRGDDAVSRMKNAEVKKQIAEIDGQIRQEQMKLTPLAQLETYRAQRQRMQRRSAWAAGKGMNDLARYFSKGQSEAADLEKVALTKYLSSIGEGKGKSGGKPVQRTAIRVVNGKAVPGQIVVINVPPNIPTGMIPQTLDPNLRADQGWQWLEGAKTIGKGSSDTDKSLSAAKMLDTHYGNYNELGQFIKDKNLIEEREYAQRLLGEEYAKNKGQKNLLQMAEDVYTRIQDDFADLHNNILKARAHKTASPEKKLEIENKMIEGLSNETGLSREFIRNKLQGFIEE